LGGLERTLPAQSGETAFRGRWLNITMPLEWAEHPSSPDGPEDHLFVALADEQPELAQRLRRRYAERWIADARLRPPQIEDAMDTIELKVAPDDQPGLWRLRLRSFYTGSTYWRHGWDGSEGAALDFMDEAAELQAGNVIDDRRHGLTLWDHLPP
jgi:hypothetical protein